MEVLKSPETEAQYRSIALRLLERFAHDAGDGRNWQTAPLDVANWLENSAREKKWSRRTLGLYRASLAWFMRQNGPIEAIESIRNVRLHLPLHGIATSGKKIKKLPPERLSRLLGYLDGSLNPLDHVIGHWLRAGVASGLRPCEWKAARLQGLRLHVENAKGNAFRSNGENRTLLFVLPEHKNEVKFIRRFLADLDLWLEADKDFKTFYAACRKRLYYVNRQLWPRSDQNICLYSTRHQFAADMKASGLKPAEIAALMGHASDESATIHYARKRSGHARFPPRISPEEIASVRRKARMHPSARN